MRFKKATDISDDKCFYGRTVRLYPTEDQKRYIDRCIELHRFVYNWTLAQKEEHYKLFKQGKVDNIIITDKEITKRFSDLRNKTKWLQEVPLHTLRNAIYDAIDSYETFFNKKSKRPKYKTKKKSKQFFKPRTEDFSMYFIGSKVRIEGLSRNDLIETKLCSNCMKKSDNRKMYNAVISKNNLGQYILSYSYIDYKLSIDNDIMYERAIGVDLNTKNLIVTSYENGEIYKTPNVDRQLKSIKRMQRKMSKLRHLEKTNPIDEESMVEPVECKNDKKRQIKLGKKYKKVVNIMDTFVKTVVKSIVSRKPSAIVLETLSVRSMKEKRHVAKSLGFHIGFNKIQQVFKHNCTKFNVPLIFADDNYPSTQLCSVCGSRNSVGISRVYNCSCCGTTMDRDLNAAFNLEKYAYI